MKKEKIETDFESMTYEELENFISEYYQGFEAYDLKNILYLSKFEEAIREITIREERS